MEQHVKTLVESGKTLQEIAERLGISYDGAKRLCRKHNLKPIRQCRYDHERVLQLHNSGMHYVDIAADVGASPNTIYYIIRRKAL